jgi:hypothetical protein
MSESRVLAGGDGDSERGYLHMDKGKYKVKEDYLYCSSSMSENHEDEGGIPNLVSSRALANRGTITTPNKNRLEIETSR